jgi:hypothetical protein
MLKKLSHCTDNTITMNLYKSTLLISMNVKHTDEKLTAFQSEYT